MYKAIIFLIIILLIIYFKKDYLLKYMDNEIVNINELNNKDKEVTQLIQYYSDYSSEELIKKLEEENLNEKKTKAIKIILNKRQSPPPSGF